MNFEHCVLWVWDCLQLQLGVDESYTLLVDGGDGESIIAEATIEVKSLFWSFSSWVCFASVI